MAEVEERQSSGTPARGRRNLALAMIAIVLVVLAVVLPPLINLGHFRRSITASIGNALGRPVYAGGMQLQLLPLPGIAITDFTVEEDPAFGYEPVLHASSVVASLRLTSLWRGRLEVSSIRLDEATLNLVRNGQGQWNIGSVLLRASQIPNAATGERRPGAHPRFPYIEASDARIDFKQGYEKKPFSLMNAEFSMWQASGGEWQLRLKAQPVRTDLELHLSDTGNLTVEGSLRRAASLNAMPVDLQAEWSGAQLGQVSRLLTGNDSGWRGDLDATATIRGSTGDLDLRTRVKVGNLRRQDFQPANTVDVDATCRSEYRHAERRLGNITCFWPIGPGHLLLTGNANGSRPVREDLQLELNQIPASFPLTLLGAMRAHAENVTATGTINGKFEVASEQRPSLSGEATVSGVSLHYAGGALALPLLHLTTQGTLPAPRRRHGASPNPPAEEALVVQAFAVAAGEPQPVIADARLTRAGFSLHLAGQASLERLMALGSNFGLLENSLAAAASKGRATLNTTTAGSWIPPVAGGSGIGTTGTLRVEGVELRPGFLRAPVEIASADIDLTPEQVSWENVALRYQGLALPGSIQFPVVCSQPTPCPASFTLQPAALDAAAIEKAFGVNQNQGLLGQFLSNALGEAQSAGWPPLQGTVQCGTLTLGRLPLHNAVTSLAMEGKTLTIVSFDAGAMGGTLHASGAVTAEDGTLRWRLDTRLTGVKVAEAARLFQEEWGTGTVSGETKLTMSGYHAPELASSASGEFRFVWQNGGMAESGGAAQASLGNFTRWSGTGSIANRVITLTNGGVWQGGHQTAATGTVSFDRALDLTLETRKGPQTITGTLQHPVMAAVH